MFRSRIRPMILLAAVLSAACGGSEPYQPRELSFARIHAFWPAWDRKETYVVRSDAEWQTVWQLHEPLTLPKTERPAIDFSRSMVLGITQGSGPNGCYGLLIRRVVEEETGLRVEYSLSEPLSEPTPTFFCTTSIVPLTAFVEVPKSDKPVSFKRTNA